MPLKCFYCFIVVIKHVTCISLSDESYVIYLTKKPTHTQFTKTGAICQINPRFAQGSSI